MPDLQMSTIDRHQFEQLCEEVAAQLPSLLSGITDEGQRSERALHQLFLRVCAHLGLDPDEQERTLGDSAGFRLMQTLEEHMDGEFLYTTIMDDRVLAHVNP